MGPKILRLITFKSHDIVSKAIGLEEIIDQKFLSHGKTVWQKMLFKITFIRCKVSYVHTNNIVGRINSLLPILVSYGTFSLCYSSAHGIDGVK